MKEKRVWKYFQYRECDAMAAYLESMALKGWHLKTFGMYFTFQKGEAKKVRYEVELFQKASEHDVIPSPDTEEFSAHYESEGWEFVCAYRKFCIFRTEDSQAPLISSHAAQRFEQISSIERHYNTVQLIAYLCLLCWEIILSLTNPQFLLSNMSLAVFLAITSQTLLCLAGYFEMLCWIKKSRKAIENEKSVSYQKRPPAFRFLLSAIFFMTLLVVTAVSVYEKDYTVLCTIASVLLLYTAVHLAAIRLKLSRRSAFLFHFVTYFLFLVLMQWVIISRIADTEPPKAASTPEPPIHLYELTGNKNRNEYATLFGNTKDRSILASREYWFVKETEDYWSANETENGSRDLSYEIVESKYPWVLRLFWSKETKYHYPATENDAEEAVLWGAKLLRHHEEALPEYILLYQNRLVQFHYNGIITPEIIRTVREKMCADIHDEIFTER